MPKCCVKKCKNNTLSVLKHHGVSYFRFPGNEIIREKWRKVIAKERNDKYFKPNPSSVICSDHFLKSDMYCTKRGMNKVTKTAIPRNGMQGDTMIKKETIQQSTSKDAIQQISTGKRKCRSEIQIKIEELSSDEDKDDKIPQQSISKELIEDNSAGQSEPHEVGRAELHNDMSPTSSRSSSPILNTPESEYFNRRILNYKKKLELKSIEIKNIKKRNKRLVNKVSSMKLIIQTLRKKNRAAVD